MKRRSVILSALALVLTLAVVMQGVIPVNAASAEVGIEIKATDINMAVTVPSQIPIIFNEDGTNTYPENWTIVNESEIAGVYLDKVRLTQEERVWAIASNVVDVSDFSANTKTVKFYVGTTDNLKVVEPEGGMTTINGSCSFARELPIPAGENLTLGFKVERCAFTESQDMQKAFDVEFTFEFM